MFQRHPNSPPRPRRAFASEALEAGVLLATYTVTNTNNDGSGSLRQASTGANNNAGADVIRFNIPTRPDNTYTINLTTGLVGDAGVTPPRYNLLSFTYDTASNTATWRLRRAVARPDRLALDLDAGGPFGVKDLAGNALDGEWDDGADVFPSGDGTPGGDFRFRINVLPGDANRNGVVNVLDDAHVRRLLGSAAPVNGSFALRYSVFADFDGSGLIDATDSCSAASTTAAACRSRRRCSHSAAALVPSPL